VLAVNATESGHPRPASGNRPAMGYRPGAPAVNPMPMTPEMDKHVVAELGSNEKLIRAAGIK
jgi:hypothetical protein